MPSTIVSYMYETVKFKYYNYTLITRVNNDLQISTISLKKKMQSMT